MSSTIQHLIKSFTFHKKYSLKLNVIFGRLKTDKKKLVVYKRLFKNFIVYVVSSFNSIHVKWTDCTLF